MWLIMRTKALKSLKHFLKPSWLSFRWHLESSRSGTFFCFVLYICTLHSCCPFFQAICITNYLTGVQCKTHINSKKYTIIFLIISNLNKSKKFQILRRMEFFLSQKLNPRQLMIWEKVFMEKNKLSLHLWHMLIETCKARSSR